MPLVSRIFRRIISVDIAEVWCRPNCVRKTGRRPTNRKRSFVGQTKPMAACWRWILSTFFVSCCRLAACQYITLSISSLDSLFFFLLSSALPFSRQTILPAQLTQISSQIDPMRTCECVANVHTQFDQRETYIFARALIRHIGNNSNAVPERIIICRQNEKK